MNFQKTIFLAVLVLLFWYPGHVNAIPAFPGAEGFGANSVGGRGGQVIKVTNLNDSGLGSFREAVMTPGPRIVVFEVSGIINLQTEIKILEPYLTIAGQTSPGGILITGRTVRLYAYQVIMQYMRFRVGSHNIANAETHDTFEIWGSGDGAHGGANAHDVIIDHSSFSWGVDEVFSTAYNPYNITVQWSIVSEGLSNAGHPKGEHSKGMLIWNKYSPDSNISLHHNYFAHNTSRSPEVGSSFENTGPVTDCRNNVAYNWYGGNSPKGAGTAKVNWVHNYSKRGPDSNSYSFEVMHNDSSSLAPQLYVLGNIGSTRLSQSEPQWNVGRHWMNELLSTSWRTTTPWPAAPVTTTEMSYEYALEILETVGASKPVRDSVDARIVKDFADGTGRIRDNVVYPDDFPTFSTPAPPADFDNDGMPDSWEAENGLNTSTNDSALDKDGDGYTNIEEYLHYLSGSTSTTIADQTTIPAAPSDLI